MHSSKFFNYKLYLNKDHQDRSYALRHDFLSLKPVRIAYFNADHQNQAAFAQIGNKVCLISIPFDLKNQTHQIHLEVIDVDYPHKRLANFIYDLNKPLSPKHQIINVAQTDSTLYFATRSAFCLEDEENDAVLNTLDHLLLLKVSL